MLRELISTKINEVFLEYQEANNIVSGDIDPWDAVRLDEIESSLAELIERICAYQQKATPSFYIYRDADGEIHNKTYNHIDTDKFFYEVSKMIAFDDCTDITVLSIVWKGKEVEYVGWQPCMKYEYKDLDGNTVWVGYFEEWDH
jgi:hypothetical protein